MKKLLIGLFLILMTTSSVLAKDKPQVVFFYSHGCSACKQFTPIYEKVMSKYSDKFKFIKQEANTSSLANKLNVNSVPSVFIINSQTGAATPVDYNCLMQQGCFEKTLSNY